MRWGEGWSYNRKFMVCCLRVLNVQNYVGRCHGNIVLDIKTRISLEAEFQSFHFQVIAANLRMFTL